MIRIIRLIDVKNKLKINIIIKERISKSIL